MAAKKGLDIVFPLEHVLKPKLDPQIARNSPQRRIRNGVCGFFLHFSFFLRLFARPAAFVVKNSERPVSLFQNPVSFGTSSWKNRSKARFFH
jgi:hypothetical protein